MIGNILNLVRWEWFKVRRRWMPWILLAILVLFTQVAVWGPYFFYRSQETSGGQVPYTTSAPVDSPRGSVEFVDCSDLRADRLPPDLSPELKPGLLQQCDQAVAQNQQLLGQLRASFTLPGSLSSALESAGGLLLILLAILTASTIGMDYGTGTLRPILVRGTGRWPYLASKFLTLALVAVSGLLVMGATTALSSLIANALLGSGGPPVLDADTWADVGVSLGKTWFSVLPYVALTGFVAIFARSSAAGIAIGLAYYFTEGLVVALLSAFFDWFDNVRDYLLGPNITAFTGGFSLTNRPSGGDIEISTLHAFLVLVAYLAVFGTLAFWLFQRRDVTGGNGG